MFNMFILDYSFELIVQNVDSIFWIVVNVDCNVNV